MVKLSVSLLKYVWYVQSICIGAIAFAYLSDGKLSGYKFLIVLGILFFLEKKLDKVFEKAGK